MFIIIIERGEKISEWLSSLGISREKRIIEKKDCENAEKIFYGDRINYACYSKNNDLIFFVKKEDTRFNKRDSSVNEIKKQIPAFVKCLFKSYGIQEKRAEYLVLVHNQNLEPDPKLHITNYTEGGSEEAAKERWETLKSNMDKLLNNKITIKELFYKLKESLVIEKDEIRLRKRLIYLLLHRIAHLFLPLDIDLMGLKEVCNPSSDIRRHSSEDSCNEYFKEILKDKGKDYYRKKYLQALYLIFGIDKFPKIQEDDKVKCENEVKLTDEEKADLLKSANQNLAEIAKYNSETMQILQKIEYLMGVNTNEGQKTVDPLHPIPKFFCYLDSLIDNSSNPSVENLLNYEKKTFNQPTVFLPTHVEVKEEKSFNDWLCELIKALEELKESIIGKE